jgi:muramoyltetrapeptide carboxypeptidase
LFGRALNDFSARRISNTRQDAEQGDNFAVCYIMSGMLRANSLIAVVAPAGIPNRQGLEQGISLLRTWGFDVVKGHHIRDQHLFTAGTVDARVADLMWALSDPAIDAVWLARGGYGCVHCLPALSKALSNELFDDRPIIGSSDATALFCAFAQTGRFRLVHGPMLASLVTAVDDVTRERIRRMLTGEQLGPLRGEHFCGPNVPVSGRLIGGNLCVYTSLVGTPWGLPASGAILVLEEVGEAAYRVDRLISQLRWSGYLDGVVGVVLGDFVSCNVPDEAKFTLDDVLREALLPLGVPVAKGARIGHNSCNLAWHYGGPAELRDGTVILNGGL